MSAFLDSHRDRFGVEPICREIEVSASAYRARRVRPPSSRCLRDAWLLVQIRRVHKDSDDIYGQFKIWDELSGEGIKVARCTVERLMRKAGIEGCSNGKVQVTTVPGSHPVAVSDLVRRDFTADRPDAVWLSDFTYVRTWQGWSYLAVVLDVYTRRIVGWQLASHMRQSLVTDAFNMANASRLRHEGGLIAHSDNGSSPQRDSRVCSHRAALRSQWTGGAAGWTTSSSSGSGEASSTRRCTSRDTRAFRRLAASSRRTSSSTTRAAGIRGFRTGRRTRCTGLHYGRTEQLHEERFIT